jgi:hypothetical protein
VETLSFYVQAHLLLQKLANKISQSLKTEVNFMKILLTVIMFVCYMFYSSLWSQGSYKLGNYVIGAGGVTGAISSNNRLSGTVGQTAVDKVQGGQYKLSSGFWNPPVIILGIEDIDKLLIPTVYELNQNYPNPFNPSTTISYGIPFVSDVSIEIFNVLGQRVRVLVSEKQPAAFYDIVWDGRNDLGAAVASGVYVCRMAARGSNGENYVQTRKMLFVR